MKTSRGPAFLPLLASILLSSCGGTVLRTIGPVTATLVPNLALSASVPNGDISVLADLPDGSSLATAELMVLDAGMWGATFTPVSSDDVELYFAVDSGGLIAQVRLDGGEDPINLTYDMTVHLPADYRWRSPTAQDPNFVGTGYGEVHVKGLKGTLPDGRDFKFWASNPLSSVSKPPMVIENVEGRIIASCWGNLTMTGCTEICMAYSEGDTVLEILGPGGSLSNTIMAGGPLTIRVKTGTNLSFYNEPLFEDSIWFLNNDGKPDIAGPVDVTDGSIPYRKVTTGNGGGNTAAFIVTVAGGSVTYKRLE